MKKFVLGLLVGIVIMATGTAFAETAIQKMIGKAVDSVYPVYVDGKRLDKDAIVIEGTSYLPTAKLGETVGYAVYWDEINKTILLDKEVSQVSTIPETPMQVLIPADPTPEPTPEPLTNEQRLDQISFDINKLNAGIRSLQVQISEAKEGDPVETWQAQLADKQAQLDALQQEKATLEAETP